MTTESSEIKVYIEKIEAENDILRNSLNEKIIEMKKLEEKAKKKKPSTSSNKRADVLEEKLLMLTAKYKICRAALISALTLCGAGLAFFLYKM